MPTLYLVRHGEAASAWGQDPDPGLSERGAAQAQSVAEQLAPKGPLQIITSPKLRCQETSKPLGAAWGREPTVEPGVTEVVMPSRLEMDRVDWLRGFMMGKWSDAEVELQCWRANLIRALLDLPQDTVVFTHFVAINTVLAEAQGDERVTIFRPDNCSVTVFEAVSEQLRLIERGQEADTRVN